MIQSGRRWYVVQTHPHAESKAASHLTRQDFETYLPRYRKRPRPARRIEMVAAPLFPRYLFVAVNMATQRWRSIQSTFGVSRLVCNGEYPAAVTDDVIEEWIGYKTKAEVDAVRLRPHPYEFTLYFDI